MRHLLIWGALLVTAASCSSPRVAATGPGVGNKTIGTVLVDSSGMTLHTYDRNGPGTAACTGFCAIAWPSAKAGKNFQPSNGFSVIERPDGSRQWTHAGSPLYA